VAKEGPPTGGADVGVASATAQNSAQIGGNAADFPRHAVPPRAKEGVLRVLIVDEHEVFADRIQSILRQPGIEVVGIARNSEQTFSAVSVGLPDVVLLCVWAKSILAESRTARALSALASADGAGLAESPFQPTLPDPPTNGDHSPPEERMARLNRYLTPRERQVLGLLMEGASNKDMARRLDIRSNTVRTHVQNVLTKLQVHTRLGAVTLAVRQGFITSASLDVPPPNGASRPPLSII
jgi:DNA-binding NarL/FixJ family response regulator